MNTIETSEQKARHLATVQTIKSLTPIPNADSIEKAEVLGWQCVVRKGEFKVGDLVVYCEVDSILPITWWSDFLKNKDRPDRPIRIRTVRLRGQISQGICFSPSVLGGDVGVPSEGEDVTERLGIIKFEPPLPAGLSGDVKGFRPSYIPKTDEVRLQTIPEILNQYHGLKIYITEKVDGQSFTAFYNDKGEFGICSRNLEIKESEFSTFWEIAKQHNLQIKLLALGKPIAIQCEFAGPGIQGNKLGLAHRTLYAFNIYDIKEARYYNFDEFINTCAQLGIETVPIISSYELLLGDVQHWVNVSTRKSQINPTIWAEGIVVRHDKELHHAKYGRVSFKVINPEFLLNYKE